MEGRRVGSYRIVRLVGNGGMASVFEGVSEPGGEHVAVKILHPSYAGNADIAARFLNEARTSHFIGHPGFVRIFDSGRLPDGVAYLLMEYLEGLSLTERLHRAGGRLTEAQAVRIGLQVATALSVAHEKGVIHRDLKPDNIMVLPDASVAGGERAKILDFGIAKIAADLAAGIGSSTRTGMLMGTPTYMAPEQCRGARGVDDRADVYAVGVILYHALGGQPPFVGVGAPEVMAMHLFDEPPPLAQVAPHVSPQLQQLVHQMMAKQPGARPAMAEVAQRLARLAPAAEQHTVMMSLRTPLARRASEQPATPTLLSGASHSSEEITRDVTLPALDLRHLLRRQRLAFVLWFCLGLLAVGLVGLCVLTLR